MPRAHNRAPSTANAPHNTTPAQAISHPRRTTVHPRHELPQPSQPWRRPTHAQGATQCTLGMNYHHPASINGTQPMPKVHATAPSGVNSAANTTPIHANPHRGRKIAHPRERNHPNSAANTTPTQAISHRRHTTVHPRRRLACRWRRDHLPLCGTPPRRTGHAVSVCHAAQVWYATTPYRPDAQVGAHCTDQPHINACKRAPHCAMYTVRRPDNLGAVRTTTRQRELDKEFSQSPNTAEPTAEAKTGPAKAKTRASRAQRQKGVPPRIA